MPPGQEAELADRLGRGDRDVRVGPSRALVGLGEVATPVLAQAARQGRGEVRTHALATTLLARDPEVGFDAALAEARRVVAADEVSGSKDA